MPPVSMLCLDSSLLLELCVPLRKRIVGEMIGRVPYFRSRLSYEREIAIGNQRFRIPVYRQLGPRHFLQFEKQTFSVISALSSLYKGCIVDIGANIGQTLLKAKALDMGREYIGLEPAPGCLGYLDALISLNELTDCCVLPVGASNKRMVSRFFYNHETDAAATVVDGFWAGQNVKKFVRSILLDRTDDLITQATSAPVAMIKVDVEGGELEALEGCERILERDRPPVVIEVLPATCSLRGQDPQAIKAAGLRLQRLNKLSALLDRFELRAYLLHPKGDLLETREFDSPTFNADLTNYLLLHDDRSSDITEISRVYRRALASKA